MTTPTDTRLELILSTAYTELSKLPNTDRVKKCKRKIMDALKIKGNEEKTNGIVQTGNSRTTTK